MLPLNIQYINKCSIAYKKVKCPMPYCSMLNRWHVWIRLIQRGFRIKH